MAVMEFDSLSKDPATERWINPGMIEKIRAEMMAVICMVCSESSTINPKSYEKMVPIIDITGPI